ncbi:MAG: hypothetical protein J6S60_04635 [Oscillospiraceae bacterium]|nr:hypothetical protein [Oscillospiraceae bacterium]
MNDIEVLRGLESIREVGVVNYRRDMAVIDEAIRIIREKLASDANLGAEKDPHAGRKT